MHFIPCTTSNNEHALVNVAHIACVTGNVVRLASGHCLTMTPEQAASIREALCEEAPSSKPTAASKKRPA